MPNIKILLSPKRLDKSMLLFSNPPNFHCIIGFSVFWRVVDVFLEALGINQESSLLQFD